MSNTSLLNSNECDQCHGPSHLGHISYSISLGISQIVSNNSPSILSATIVNNNYPLSQSSISLQSSPDFVFSPSNSTTSLTKSLGILARSSTTLVSWNIIPQVTSNKTISLQVYFQGTASNHTTFTYSNCLTQKVFVTTAKVVSEAILQVQSNPVADSSFLVGQVLKNTSLTISNTGKVEMDNVTVNTTGNILVNGTNHFTISSISPDSKKIYPIELDTSHKGNSSITITYAGSKPIQSVQILITVSPEPPPSSIFLLGDLLGYITYFLLFLSVIAGVGVYHLKKVISGRKIRILHSDLSNLSFTVAIIHGVILSFPNSPWFGTYSWFELLPLGTTTFTSSGQLGLELGRWTLFIMYLGVISGYFIAQIIKTFSRKVGISIHMLTYLALIFGLIHALLIGNFAKTYIMIPVIMVLSVISVFLLKYEIKFQQDRKKALRAKKLKEADLKDRTSRVTSKKLPENQVNVNRKQLSNILKCKKCLTENDFDAIYCKKCAFRL